MRSRLAARHGELGPMSCTVPTIPVQRRSKTYKVESRDVEVKTPCDTSRPNFEDRHCLSDANLSSTYLTHRQNARNSSVWRVLCTAEYRLRSNLQIQTMLRGRSSSRFMMANAHSSFLRICSHRIQLDSTSLRARIQTRRIQRPPSSSISPKT